MRTFRFARVLLAVAAFAAVALVGGSPAKAAGPGNWIMNVGSGKCLTPITLAPGAEVWQMPCDESLLQRWQVVFPTSSRTVFQVRNLNTGFCLDVRGVATNHTPVQQWPCANISNQRWDSGPNYIQLRSRVSGTSSHCLDVPGATWDTVPLQIYRCNDTAAQIWRWGPIVP